MCGHVGCAGRLSVKEEKIFKQLLILDTLRGEDSTGICAVTYEGVTQVAKSVGDPYQLFDTVGAAEIFRSNNRVLIGHNRFATQGKVNRRNAHPFELNTLIGAHNGTLTNKWQLKNGNKFDVDSEALFHDIEELGLEKAIAGAKGAWALVWWDLNNNTLNFLRNKERPLFLCYSEDKKVVFWASEQWMLTTLLSREGYKFCTPEALPEDTHLSFNINLALYNECKEIDKPRSRRVESAKEVVVVHQSPKVRNMYTLPLNISQDYLGSKNAKFKVINVERDKFGQEYLELLDVMKPEYDVRMYFNNRTELRKSVGKQIKGDVSSIGYEDGKTYFKVSPWQATIIENVPKDKHGNEVSERDFLTHYHTCTWCSSPIAYGDDCHIIDTTSGVICKDCLAEPQIQEYLK